jgi:cytidine deaminase
MGNHSDWPPAHRSLLKQLAAPARSVSANAHAPYSGFHVGAALLTHDGRVFAGCNLESASYGLTQCAERNALGTAIAAGVRPGEISALAIYLPGMTPLPPCGACRQVMVELMQADGPVLSFCDSAEVLSWTAAELMPQAFTGR